MAIYEKMCYNARRKKIFDYFCQHNFQNYDLNLIIIFDKNRAWKILQLIELFNLMV